MGVGCGGSLVLVDLPEALTGSALMDGDGANDLHTFRRNHFQKQAALALPLFSGVPKVSDQLTRSSPGRSFSGRVRKGRLWD